MRVVFIATSFKTIFISSSDENFSGTYLKEVIDTMFMSFVIVIALVASSVSTSHQLCIIPSAYIFAPLSSHICPWFKSV